MSLLLKKNIFIRQKCYEWTPEGYEIQYAHYICILYWLVCDLLDIHNTRDITMCFISTLDLFCNYIHGLTGVSVWQRSIAAEIIVKN